MNNHDHWREALAVYRDLPPGERQQVDNHLAGCAECRATFAAYAHQDAALGRLPTLQPRARLWPPARARAAGRWLNGFGQALALGGLAALAWMIALQIQYARLLNTGANTPGAPLPLVPQTGVAFPPAVINPPSPWLPALPWLGGSLLAIGMLFVLGGRSRWPAAVGAMLAAGILISFVPPFSTLPNPAGLVWRFVGGYSYDPNLPFKNDFLIAGRPDEVLRPYLDQLIGQVGLSPLDPNQPLRSYQILRVGLHPHRNRVVLITTRFVYADGASRIYPVPLTDPAQDLRGLWLAGWRADGLQRLRAQHLALPGQPFAGPAGPISLGAAQRLDAVNPQANRLDEANPGHWLWESVRVQRLVWAPDGKSFLAVMETDPGRRGLWDVPLDGSKPRLVATGDIREYGWSPAGDSVVLTLFDPAAAALAADRPFAIRAAAAGSNQPPLTPIVTGLPSAQLPGLAVDGIWFLADGCLWRVSYQGGQPELVSPGLASSAPRGEPRPAPDGRQVAFACGADLCLLPLPQLPGGAPTANITRIAGLQPAELSWSFDGARLAVIDRPANPGPPVKLEVVNGLGGVQFSADIAPSDVTDAPQWTPDGQTILVQTYPFQGRRIIAVDVASQQVLDLSQPHWDAYFALAPDGRQLLLNNGRGDFWTAGLIPQN